MTGSDVESARNGDALAFSRLAAEITPSVRAIATAITRDPVLGGDVAQDTLLAAWIQLESLKRPESFRAWVMALARNRARDAVRRRASRAEVALEGDVAQAPPSGPTPEQERALSSALETLHPADREILVLHYWQGKSMRAIATELSVEETAVRKRMSRARARLRAAVDSEAFGVAFGGVTAAKTLALGGLLGGLGGVFSGIALAARRHPDRRRELAVVGAIQATAIAVSWALFQWATPVAAALGVAVVVFAMWSTVPRFIGDVRMSPSAGLQWAGLALGSILGIQGAISGIAAAAPAVAPIATATLWGALALSVPIAFAARRAGARSGLSGCDGNCSGRT